MTRIAVLGNSDAGLRLGVALQASGADVVGFDLAPAEYSPLSEVSSLEDAIIGADLVLSFVGPQQALSTAQNSAALLPSGSLFVDFTPGTPDAKKKMASAFTGDVFVDAAQTSDARSEASGPGATTFAKVFGQLNQEVTVLSEIPGDAAARALIRTLFRNGMAEVLSDTLWAAESLGIQDSVWDGIQNEFSSMNADSAQALIDDAAHNFKRHQIAMQDVVELLAITGYESTMIAPIQFTHGRIMHGKKVPFSQAPTKKWLK
jgi:3-hydroxyisobutyrate dehydrogenase-like beta-hydroxyacid dehydrogenase